MTGHLLNFTLKEVIIKTLSISSSADRAYGRVLRADWIFSNIAFIRSQNYKHAKSSGFSNKIIKRSCS